MLFRVWVLLGSEVIESIGEFSGFRVYFRFCFRVAGVICA